MNEASTVCQARIAAHKGVPGDSCSINFHSKGVSYNILCTLVELWVN
jgi:hypothetical protein